MPGDNIVSTYPYGKRGWYPHMKPADVLIWERFIAKYADEYDNVQYDVPVGELPAFDVTVNPDSGGSAALLYKKKIDVVALRAARIDIIELKPNAGASAVGQVKIYKKLYKEDYNPSSEPNCVIITDKVSSDVQRFADEEGVKIFVV